MLFDLQLTCKLQGMLKVCGLILQAVHKHTMHAARQPRLATGVQCSQEVFSLSDAQLKSVPCTACCCCHLHRLLLVACCLRAQTALHLLLLLLLSLLLLLACWLVVPGNALSQFGCNTAHTTAKSVRVWQAVWQHDNRNTVYTKCLQLRGMCCQLAWPSSKPIVQAMPASFQAAFTQKHMHEHKITGLEPADNAALETTQRQ
jgi:hypothetical protein